MPAPPDLGQFDRCLRFERGVFTRNARNEAVRTGWTLVATVSAARASVSDAERASGAAVSREVSDRFTTHWSLALAGLRGGDQVVDITDPAAPVAYDLVGKKEVGGFRVAIEFSAAARPEVGA